MPRETLTLIRVCISLEKKAPKNPMKGLPKLAGFAPCAENWPNRKAYKAEILHGSLEYPNDKV